MLFVTNCVHNLIYRWVVFRILFRAILSVPFRMGKVHSIKLPRISPAYLPLLLHLGLGMKRRYFQCHSSVSTLFVQCVRTITMSKQYSYSRLCVIPRKVAYYLINPTREGRGRERRGRAGKGLPKNCFLPTPGGSTILP